MGPVMGDLFHFIWARYFISFSNFLVFAGVYACPVLVKRGRPLGTGSIGKLIFSISVWKIVTLMYGMSICAIVFLWILFVRDLA